MLTQAFATPRRHPRSKPFLDHVLAFSVADGRIWLRNYQVALPSCSYQTSVCRYLSMLHGDRRCDTGHRQTH